jgi:hypothetical protein
MAITLQDLKPTKAFYVVPECQEPYAIADNQFVATPWQIINIILSI